jgi:hypothetical protein
MNPQRRPTPATDRTFTGDTAGFASGAEKKPLLEKSFGRTGRIFPRTDRILNTAALRLL